MGRSLSPLARKHLHERKRERERVTIPRLTIEANKMMMVTADGSLSQYVRSWDLHIFNQHVCSITPRLWIMLQMAHLAV